MQIELATVFLMQNVVRKNHFLSGHTTQALSAQAVISMKLFVTGASGFVGGAVLKQLASQHALVAMSRTIESDKKITALGGIPIRCQLGEVSATDLAGCDVIIHCAAHIGPHGTRKHYWRTNVDGTVQLLEVAKKAGVKRFIHIGTEAGCFHGQNMCSIDETYPLASNSPYSYSATKAEAERRVLAANEPGFATLSLRPRFIWGPGDQTILPELIKAVNSGQFIWIAGGRSTTSSTHIDNLSHAVELALEKGLGGEAYFIVDEQDQTFHQLRTQLLATQNLTVPDKSVPGWVIRSGAAVAELAWKLFDIKGEPPITRFTAALMSRECTIRGDKAQSQLGYEPVVSLQEGLDELCRLWAESL